MYKYTHDQYDVCYWSTNNTHHIGHVYNMTIYYIRNVDDNKHLLDYAMSNMKIYSVETRNIHPTRRSRVGYSWRDGINLHIGQIAVFNKCFIVHYLRLKNYNNKTNIISSPECILYT